MPCLGTPAKDYSYTAMLQGKREARCEILCRFVFVLGTRMLGVGSWELESTAWRLKLATCMAGGDHECDYEVRVCEYVAILRVVDKYRNWRFIVC